MNKKLTLSLDETIIIQAKDYAKKQNESLSGLVEKYFTFLTTRKQMGISTSVSHELEKLAGIINIPEDYDYKEDYRKYRSEKVINE